MPTRPKIIVALCSLLMLLTVLPALAGQQLAASGSLNRPDPVGALNKAGTAAAYDTSKADATLIVSDIIGTLLGLLGLVFIILIIYGGFLWMTASGNEEQIGKAKKILMNATIGIIVVSLAYAITFYVFTILLPSTRTDTQQMFQ